MDRGLWTVSCLLIVLGILLLVAGIACQYYQNYREELGGRTTARVIDLILEESEEGKQPLLYRNCYYPVFEYYAQGKLYKVKHPKGSYPSEFQLNQEIPLSYDREDPLEYKIAEDGMIKRAAQALYGAGVICVAAGCIIFLRFARRG